MSIFGLIEYADASPEVRAIYDDIMATRKTDWINNFWKAIAHDPAMLKRTWEDIKQIMAPERSIRSPRKWFTSPSR
jgi:glutathionylspermidine synthase